MPRRTSGTRARGTELTATSLDQSGSDQAAVLGERERHVVEHAQVGEQRPELEQHARGAPAGGLQGTRPIVPWHYIGSIEQHTPACAWLLATAHQAQNGGFALTRSPHQGGDRPGHGKGQAIQNHLVACRTGRRR